MNLLERPIYTERIIPFINKQVIKVLTGQRRVGKSYVLLQLMDHIRHTDSNANIVYINMELDEFITGISKEGIIHVNLIGFLTANQD